MTRPLDVVDRVTLRQWYHRGKLPEPDAVLTTIERWKA